MFDESSPEKVWIDDKPILLTPYPYELLELLARNAARVVAYHEIDEALWPDVKVEPQQISAHKRAVVKGVAAVLGDVTARALVETLPRRGLRLNLAPENVVWKRVTDEQ